jgi:hypothetical protein
MSEAAVADHGADLNTTRPWPASLGCGQCAVGHATSKVACPTGTHAGQAAAFWVEPSARRRAGVDSQKKRMSGGSKMKRSAAVRSSV